MKLPTWDELVPEQLDVMDFPLDQSLFVTGPPGSGKTVLAVQRAEACATASQEVALVTFNRMLRRLSTLLTNGTAVPKTMHSFASYDFRKRAGKPQVPTAVGVYDYDWDTMLAQLKEMPASNGTWDHVVVDEGQDLPEGFFRYLHDYASRVISVFADEDQALDIRGTSLKQIRAAAYLPKPIILSLNHRNSPEIAALAEHFHSGVLPAATPRRTAIGHRPRLVRMGSLSDTAEFIATWVENRGGTAAVLVSSNATADDIFGELVARLPETRVDLYKSSTANEDEIALVEDGITILNTKSVKGQEFDSVFILELDQFVPFRDKVMKRAMYMMCTRARDYLFLMTTGVELTRAAIRALPGPEILERE
jgi:superfamily I DNA/RNA helicase